MDSQTINLVFLDSEGYVDTHRVSPGGPGVSVEQFLVRHKPCHMRLSSYVLTCHLSFHPRPYRYQRVMLTPTGSAQGGRGVSVEYYHDVAVVCFKFSFQLKSNVHIISDACVFALFYCYALTTKKVVSKTNKKPKRKVIQY